MCAAGQSCRSPRLNRRPRALRSAQHTRNPPRTAAPRSPRSSVRRSTTSRPTSSSLRRRRCTLRRRSTSGACPLSTRQRGAMPGSDRACIAGSAPLAHTCPNKARFQLLPPRLARTCSTPTTAPSTHTRAPPAPATRSTLGRSAPLPALCMRSVEGWCCCGGSAPDCDAGTALLCDVS